LIVIREIDLELWVGDAWWIDKQAVEDVEVGGVSLGAVDGGLRAGGEAGLDEVLHVGGVAEGEGGVGAQGDVDVVGVDAGGSDLGEGGDASWGNHCRSGRSRGGRCGSGGGSCWLANRRLAGASITSLNLAANASSRVGAASITSFTADNESISTGWVANSLGVSAVSSSSAGDALSGGLAGLARWVAGKASAVTVEVLSVRAGNCLQDQLLADSVGVHVEAWGASASIDGRIKDGVEGAGGTGSLEGKLVSTAGKDTNTARVKIVSSAAYASTIRDNLVEAASVAVALPVQELIALALTDAERSLGNLSLWAGASVAVIDSATRADGANTIDQESIGEGSTGSADLTWVIGIALLAAALAVDQNFVDLAGWAGIAISSWGGSSWAKLASSVDSAKSGEAAAALSGSIVDLVSSAFLRANSPLIGVESRETGAILGGWVVGGVDWTGDTVSVGNEVVRGAGLAGAAEQTISWVASASIGRSAISGILSADIDALAGRWAPEGTLRALRTDSSVVGVPSVARAWAISVLVGIGDARSALNTGTVGEITASIADTNAKTIVVGIGSAANTRLSGRGWAGWAGSRGGLSGGSWDSLGGGSWGWLWGWDGDWGGRNGWKDTLSIEINIANLAGALSSNKVSIVGTDGGENYWAGSSWCLGRGWAAGTGRRRTAGWWTGRSSWCSWSCGRESWGCRRSLSGSLGGSLGGGLGGWSAGSIDCSGELGWDSGAGGDSRGGHCSLHALSSCEDEAKLAGASSAGNASVFVDWWESSSGARSQTISVISNQARVAVGAKLLGEDSDSDVDQGEVSDGGGGGDGEDVAGVDAGGEGDGEDAVEGDKVEPIETVGVLVEGVADVAAHRAGILALGDLSAVGAEGGSGGGEGQPGEPDSSKTSGDSQCDTDCQLGALEVGGADRNLNNVRRNVKPVDKHPDDGVVALGEGGDDVGVGEGAVAGVVGLDVVCVNNGLPTRK
jgi:hypothetical protein